MGGLFMAKMQALINACVFALNAAYEMANCCTAVRIRTVVP